MEDFKFCMSLKSFDEDEKRNAWIRRRAEWWAHRRLDKSSEHVWDMRTSVLHSILFCSFIHSNPPFYHSEPLKNWPPAVIEESDAAGAQTFS